MLISHNNDGLLNWLCASGVCMSFTNRWTASIRTYLVDLVSILILFIGLKCDSCEYGFYNLSSENAAGCSPCLCNPFGSTDPYCNRDSGQCLCKENVEGSRCDRCVPGYHSFNLGCVPCDCDSKGGL